MRILASTCSRMAERTGQPSRKVDVASSRLEAAFNKSKGVFLEEAADIIRTTFESPTSRATSNSARSVGGIPRGMQLTCPSMSV